MNNDTENNTLKIEENKFHSALHTAIGKSYDKNKPKRHEHNSRWADTVVTFFQKVIIVTVYVNFKSPKVSETQRSSLISLAVQGIAKYWSRAITIDNQIYKVNVSAQHKAESSFPVILKMNNNSKDYGRSFNPGVLGVDARFIYNKGFFPSDTFSVIYDLVEMNIYKKINFLLAGVLVVLTACKEPEPQFIFVENAINTPLVISANFQSNEGDARPLVFTLEPGQKDGWRYIDESNEPDKSFLSLTVKSDKCEVKLDRADVVKRFRKNGTWTLLVDESLTECK